MSNISHIPEEGRGLRQKWAAGPQQALAVRAAGPLARAVASRGARPSVPGLLTELLETKLVLPLPFCSRTKEEYYYGLEREAEAWGIGLEWL